jgi:hypothetical protein
MHAIDAAYCPLDMKSGVLAYISISTRIRHGTRTSDVLPGPQGVYEGRRAGPSFFFRGAMVLCRGEEDREELLRKRS